MNSLCRLCAKCTVPTDTLTKISEIESKLKLCCGWSPSENESKLPQSACKLCVEELLKSWAFAERVKLVQEQFNEQINSTNDSDTEPSTPTTHITSVFVEDEHNLDSEDEVSTLDDCISNGSNNSPKKSQFAVITQKPQNVIDKPALSSEAFLFSLPDEDCLADGSISQKGIAELEELYPEIKTAWNECQYTCKKCDRTFKSPQNYYAHNRSFHFKEVLSMGFFCFYCDCKHCSEYNLDQHIAKEHFPHLKFRCSFCSDYFWNNKKLKKHRDMHTDVQYKCELCEQICQSKEILKGHISYSHLKRKQIRQGMKYTCDICSKNFTTKFSIRNHMSIHTKKYDFICDQCGKKFSSRGALKLHLDSFHIEVRAFACDQCDKKFKTKANLLSHRIIHSDKLVECTICSKRLRTKRNLKVHMRQHNNEYPYKCKFCDRKFRTDCSVKTHERIHTNEKPYACKSCGYRSTNWGNLNKHSMRIHSVDLRKKSS